MAVSRSEGRNMHIYLENEPVPIGGLRLHPGTLHITHVNFYHFIEILIFPVIPDELLATVTGHLVQVVDRDTPGFEAAHVWPLYKGQEWINQGIYRWITDPDMLQSNLYISILYICITSLLALSMPARIWDYG